MVYSRKSYGSMFEDKTWNMDALFTERIDKRLNELDIVTCEGNQPSRYRLLHAIFIATHFKYIDQVPDIKDKFQEVKQLLQTTPNTYSKSSQAQHQSIIITKAEGLLDNLHFLIVNLLYESDLICLKKVKGLNPELEFARDYS